MLKLFNALFLVLALTKCIFCASRRQWLLFEAPAIQEKCRVAENLPSGDGPLVLSPFVCGRWSDESPSFGRGSLARLWLYQTNCQTSSGKRAELLHVCVPRSCVA